MEVEVRLVGVVWVVRTREWGFDKPVDKALAVSFPVKVRLYWSKSEHKSDVAWNDA